MIKSGQVTFKELPVPILSKVFSILQPEKELITEHWKHLISVLEVEGTGAGNERSAYMIYKCKFNLAFVNFQEGCLLYQRKFKIIYGQVHEITALKLHLINIKFEDAKKKELLVAVGFADGCLEVYNLSISDKSVILKKLVLLQNLDTPKYPLNSIAFAKRNLYVTRTHYVHLYRDFLTAAASMIIQDQGTKNKEVSFKFVVEKVALDEMANGATISISGGINNLYVYNETEGARSLGIEGKVIGSIIDSLVCVRQAYGENILLGDASNHLKIIYHDKNYVQRYAGFKNYCSAIDLVLFPQHQQAWIGDLNGCITYFQRYLGVDIKPPNKHMRMVEHYIKYANKICQNGIKEMKIAGRLLFILDTESNIHIFDILRKDALEHLKTVELESVQEYQSHEA